MVYLACTDDASFNQALTSNASKAVIVDFFAEWCGPCKMMAPFFKSLAERKPDVVFLSVDIDKCKATAASNSVKSVPTFAAFLNKSKMEQITGPSKEALEAFVNKWAESGAASEPSPIPGQIDLTAFIDKKQAECLNEDDSNTLAVFLEGNGKIVSDCDEQLIINLPFNRPVKIHSILIKGPKDEAPKMVKVFANTVATLDFDKAQNSESIQTIDFEENELANLRFVKFQNVKNLQLFIENNKGDGERTIIEVLKIYGQPLDQSTNMGEFQRVAGKMGEVGH